MLTRASLRLAKLESFKDLIITRSKWLGNVSVFKQGIIDDNLMDGVDLEMQEELDRRNNLIKKDRSLEVGLRALKERIPF